MGFPQLPRYQVLGELGQGGMSIVYLAKDQQLNREIALKVLSEPLARQEDARRRLHREAMAGARLKHRAIVSIFDASGPDATVSYIVQERIEGPTLRAWVEQHGPPPWPEIAMLAGHELTEALRHAHQAGILHRDLKPENVMVHADGQLKLMDFGIAQIATGATRLTQTGTLMGSPAHMAPEVIDGKPSDVRSDLYALGTILYWLTCGCLPFEAPHPSALFKRILAGDFEDPQLANPKVGNGWARILRSLLAPDPDHRYADADGLLAAISHELRVSGLWPPAEPCRAHFRDPERFREAQVSALVARLLEAGDEALHHGRRAAAADLYNRALAHAPDDPEAHARVLRLARGARQNRLLRRTTGAAVVLLGLGGTVGWAVRSPWSPPRPEGPALQPPPKPETTAMASVAPGSELAGSSEGPIERAVGRDRLDQSPGPVSASRPAAPTPEGRATSRREPGPRPRPGGETPTLGSPPARAFRNAAGTGQSADRPRPDRSQEAPRSDLNANQAKETEEGTLRVQIGRGYGDVWVDGALVLELSFGGTLRLEPGKHQVEVVRSRDKILRRLGIPSAPTGRPFPQFGRFEARSIQVEPDGSIHEWVQGEKRPLPDGVLRFSIPMSPEQARQLPGWISSQSVQ